MSEILAQVGRVERFGQSSASEVDYAEPDCIPAQSPVDLVHSPHYSLRTLEVNQAVEKLYDQRGALPLFKGYPGRVPFPAVTCISLNEQVVHGIPGSRAIRDGDLVKIDTACKLNGWCADAAITVIVGEVRPEWRRLVQVGEQ